jgi:hypothetical protein
MASFSDHILQAEHNLAYLRQIIHQLHPRNLSWEVTVCYYVAVHLVNAHIESQLKVSYQSHDRIKKALFYDRHSSARISKQAFDTYNQLTRLSRIARYLFDSQTALTPVQITQQHRADAELYLNRLIAYFNGLYALTIPLV